MQHPKMGGLMVVGLCHLQTLVSAYEQFISGFGTVSFKTVLVSLYGTAPWSTLEKGNYNDVQMSLCITTTFTFLCTI